MYQHAANSSQGKRMKSNVQQIDCGETMQSFTFTPRVHYKPPTFLVLLSRIDIKVNHPDTIFWSSFFSGSLGMYCFRPSRSSYLIQLPNGHFPVAALRMDECVNPLSCSVALDCYVLEVYHTSHKSARDHRSGYLRDSYCLAQVIHQGKNTMYFYKSINSEEGHHVLHSSLIQWAQ